MIGHEGIVRALTKLFRAKLPGVLREIERELEINTGSIPNFPDGSIYPHWADVVAKGRFPSLMILQDDSETRNTGRQVSSAAEWDEYEWTYPIRMVLHNVGAGEGETELERKRLMMALRIVLLRYRGLIMGDTEDGQILGESVREIFTGGVMDEHKKMLLESEIRFDVRTNEIVTSAQGNLGSATTTTKTGWL